MKEITVHHMGVKDHKDDLYGPVQSRPFFDSINDTYNFVICKSFVSFSLTLKDHFKKRDPRIRICKNVCLNIG